MRLLSPKEIKTKIQVQETNERARLALLNEELLRKEKVLSAISGGIDEEKERTLKEFEYFKADIVEKKTQLHNDIYILEQREAILEVNTTRERAEVGVIEELEKDFLDQKRKQEEIHKEREDYITSKEKSLFKREKDFIERIEDLNRKEILLEEKHKRLEVQKQELKKKEEKFFEETWKRINQVRREQEVFVEKFIQIEAERSSNEIVKKQLEEGWKNLEENNLTLVHEKTSIQDTVLGMEEQQRKISIQAESNERVQNNLEEEYRKMEREKVAIKEKKDDAHKLSKSIEEERKKLKSDVASNRIKNQHIESEQREIKRTKIKMKDERAVLDSAWKELQSKQNG